jgi:hypothetical protein
LPCRHRRGQTLEFDSAQVPALEEAADLPAGGGVDYHLIRVSDALQAGS